MVPQPGTSQTPQEMGAEATREKNLTTSALRWNVPLITAE